MAKAEGGDEPLTFWNKIKGLCRTSLFISLLMKVINAVYDCLRDGFFGRLMTSYSSEEKMFRKGIIGNFFSKRGVLASWGRRFRLRLAEFFEKSALLDIGLKRSTYLLGCSLRVYGIFLFTFGAYTVLIHYIKFYAFSGMTQNVETVIWGIAAIVLAIPMIGSRQTVAELLQKGLISHLLLVDTFGIPEERFDISRVKGGGRYNFALLIGMITGMLTFLIPPRYLILFILGLLVVAVVMSYPEVGVLALIALIPFQAYSEGAFRTLEFGIALTAIAYLGKLIRGKRVIRFSLMDTLIALFGVLLWFSGVVSLGGEDARRQVGELCLFLLMYFMIVNLIRTPAWLHRAVIAGIGSTSLLAVWGGFQYLNKNQGALVGTFARDQVTAIFDSSVSLAAYLLLFFPLLVAVWTTAAERKNKIVALGCGVAVVAALILTGVRSAWFGAIAALLVFFLIYSRKTACWLVLFGMTIPIWQMLLPQNVVERLFSVADVANPLVYQRLGTWRGAINMLADFPLGGIGYGSTSFQEVYPAYSLSGLAQAEQIDQFYLSLMGTFGLFGLLVFVVVIVVFFQNCFSYIVDSSENYSRTFVAAGFSAIVGALVMGCGCDIWYDKSVFLAFFTIFAVTCAYIRAGVLIRARNQDVSGIDVSHAYVDLHFDV